MARLWRLSVVVIVLTLAPMQAWAECAWVLWKQWTVISYNKQQAEGTFSDFTNAFDTRAECAQAQAREIQDHYDSSNSAAKSNPQQRLTVTRTDDGFSVSHANGLTTYRHLCVPDTIDPRGPKQTTR
jgi:hypothetical protein